MKLNNMTVTVAGLTATASAAAVTDIAGTASAAAALPSPTTFTTVISKLGVFDSGKTTMWAESVEMIAPTTSTAAASSVAASTTAATENTLERRGGYKGYSDLKGKKKQRMYENLLDDWRKMNPVVNIQYAKANGEPVINRAASGDYAYDISFPNADTVYVENPTVPAIDDPVWSKQMPTKKEWKKMKDGDDN